MNIYEPLVVVVVIYEPLVVVVFNVYNEMFFKNVLKKMSCFLNVFFVFPWLYFRSLYFPLFHLKPKKRIRVIPSVFWKLSTQSVRLIVEGK